MSLTNPNKPVTEQRLSEFYQQILPFLGGMPDILTNKFSKGDLYSTDEKIIGRWTDGKPIYQKTFYNITSPQVTTSGTSINKYVEVGATIDQVIDIKVVSVLSGSWYTLPTTWGTNTASFLKVDVNSNAVSSNKNSLNISANSTATNSALINASLQYTKTTDSSVEIGVDTDYSTIEKIIGTWIDGKPLYQKTFVSTMPTTSANGTQVTKYIEIGASVDTAVLVQGFSKSTNAWQTFPRIVESTNTSNNKVLFNRIAVRPESAESNKNTVAVISNMVDSNGLQCHITIQYTKTTD